MKVKIVTAYWMDAEGLPFQGANPSRKYRYIGSLIAYCQNLHLPIVCYTHEKSINELQEIKTQYNLTNLELKILELADIKYHKEINKIRYSNLERYIPELDGRGCEIMWGKFDVVERELTDCDRVYWLDVGMQHPGLLTWGYAKIYNKAEDHQGDKLKSWWTLYDVYNFPDFFNYKIFNKLNDITLNKVCFIVSNKAQISYPFQQLGITSHPFTDPYPVGAMFGGDTKTVQLFIDKCWNYIEKTLNTNTLITEEAIMKPAFDEMAESNLLPFNFTDFHNSFHDHDLFHFTLWTESSNLPKPFYMVWHDILNY